jgi:hypothetical protein
LKEDAIVDDGKSLPSPKKGAKNGAPEKTLPWDCASALIAAATEPLRIWVTNENNNDEAPLYDSGVLSPDVIRWQEFFRLEISSHHSSQTLNETANTISSSLLLQLLAMHY